LFLSTNDSMKVLDSCFANQVEATYCIEIGDFHFFKDFVIAEFNQGCYVSFKDLYDIHDLGSLFYQDGHFGFISNRVNSYSIDLIDFHKNRNKLKLIDFYAIVTYSHFSKKMLPMEDYYFRIDRHSFNYLDNAIHWIFKKIHQDGNSTSNKFHRS